MPKFFFLKTLIVLSAFSLVGDGVRAAVVPLMFYATYWILIVLHEFTHAIAAWLVGGSVGGFAFGSGERVSVWSVARLRIALHAEVDDGACCVLWVSESGVQWRMALIVAAPLLAHAVFAVLGFRPALDGFDAGGIRHPLVAVYAMNALFLITNICTFRGPEFSDGAALWRMFRGERITPSADEFAFVAESAVGTARQQYDAVKRLVDGGSQAYEDDLCIAAALCDEPAVARRFAGLLEESWQLDAELESEEYPLLSPRPPGELQKYAREWVAARAGQPDAYLVQVEQAIQDATTDLARAYFCADAAWFASELDPLGGKNSLSARLRRSPGTCRREPRSSGCAWHRAVPRKCRRCCAGFVSVPHLCRFSALFGRSGARPPRRFAAH